MRRERVNRREDYECEPWECGNELGGSAASNGGCVTAEWFGGQLSALRRESGERGEREQCDRCDRRLQMTGLRAHHVKLVGMATGIGRRPVEERFWCKRRHSLEVHAPATRHSQEV